MYESRTPLDIFTIDDMQKLLKTGPIIRQNITFRGEHLERLEGVAEVHGNMCILGRLADLGELRLVKGDLLISCSRVCSEIRSLGHLEEVGGNANLRYSDVTHLGELRRVGGDLNLRDRAMSSLKGLEYVGGNLNLSMQCRDAIDLSKVTVKGKIKYWNDGESSHPQPKSALSLTKAGTKVPFWRHIYVFSTAELLAAGIEQQEFYATFRNEFLKGTNLDLEGNSNYAFNLLYDLINQYESNRDFELFRQLCGRLGNSYPDTRPYAERTIIEKLKESGDHEQAWKTKLVAGGHISVQDIFEYGKYLGRSLVDALLISKLAGISYLTKFGQRNIDSIQNVALESLRGFEVEHSRPFIEVFFRELHINDQGWRTLHGFQQDYYERFFTSRSEYEYWKGIDSEQQAGGYGSEPVIAKMAGVVQLRRFLTAAEDIYRERIGMPRVGEGWISETELYYKIKTQFPDLEVIQHGRPSWLGQQSLDIFLPTLNLAFEYQGVQHFRPVGLFGGEPALEKNIERDQRKLEKAAENGCSIVYVYEGYKFDEVKTLVESRISASVPILEFRHINRPQDAAHLLNFGD